MAAQRTFDRVDHTTRKLVAFAAVCAILAALLAAAAPPAQAAVRDNATLTAGPVAVQKNGVRYTLSLHASHSSNTEFSPHTMRISLTRVRNPDGVAIARQRLDFNFESLTAFRPFASPPKIATGDPSQMAPHGSANLSLKKSSSEIICNGDVERIRGTLEGKLVLRTNTKLIGALTVTSIPNVRLHRYSSAACLIPKPGPNPCPQVGSELDQDPFGASGSPFYISARRVSADRAKVFVDDGVSLPLNYQQGYAYLDRYLDVTLPAAHVKIGSTLHDGSVQSASGTFLYGKATFSSSAAATTTAWQSCGDPAKNLETNQTYRTGKLHGSSFLVDWLVGTDDKLPSAGTTVAAFRHRVRQAP